MNSEGKRPQLGDIVPVHLKYRELEWDTNYKVIDDGTVSGAILLDPVEDFPDEVNAAIYADHLEQMKASSGWENSADYKRLQLMIHEMQKGGWYKEWINSIMNPDLKN